jgi:hypothetical protein
MRSEFIAHIEKAKKVTKKFSTASDAQKQITVLLNVYN